MSGQDKTTNDYSLDANNTGVPARETMGKILSLSGSEALNSILDHEDTGKLIREISRVDLFWLIKKIGEDDSFPILRLASDEQWEYILDMELWKMDRIQQEETFHWLDRFYRAAPERLARWLYSEDGNLLAHLFFNFALDVKVKEEQDYQPPDGYFTFDNLYFISVLDKEHEEVIEPMLRMMASEDYNRFQALMLGLSGVIPAEVEEELYRLKSIRMAEVGYLPFEEAISIYSYQRPDLLKQDSSDYRIFYPDEEAAALVPVTPLAYAAGDNLFSRSLTEINDSPSLERLRLEFAGLCNQIFSADAALPEDMNDLIKITRKAAGYLNIGLESLSGGDLHVSGEFIKNNPLVAIFRVGFGRSLEVKWEAEKRIKTSWFAKNGLKADFWGDEWGGKLTGIMMKRPLFYTGDYRPFEALLEVENTRQIVRKVMLLDRIMEEIASLFDLKKELFKDPLLTFHTILFHSWAIRRLKKENIFTPLSIDQTKKFFTLIRGKESSPPFTLKGFRDVFISDCTSLIQGIEGDNSPLLKETLSGLWEGFVEEHALLDLSVLDPRFSKYIIVNDNNVLPS